MPFLRAAKLHIDYKDKIASRYIKQGYTVEDYTLETRVDYEGIDLICCKNTRTVLVKCKYCQNLYITTNEIHKFYEDVELYKKNHQNDSISATFWTSQGDYNMVTEAYNYANNIGIRFHYGKRD